MNVEIIPLAQQDITRAARYLEKQRTGLRDEFLAEVDESVANICNGPQRFEEIRPGIRQCLMQRFRYGIYFRMPDANTVRIIVVRHHSRRPGFGLRRK